ncbi:uncharacterized protein LOC126845525 [Adelges cooleyi]|uniref:uncharacterized protein LOC126845525 n=1 Tax=Adelges cooleyi TaxID=133065 RepID=UPI00217F74A9|nr:uncharacterized protein LOC126845525 [Adelges cooleyi]
MDDYCSEVVIKIEEEDEDTKEQITGALVEETKPNIIKELYKSIEESCNNTIVKVEVDLVNGHCFESVIEVEKSVLMDVPTTNYIMDEIQPFVCDVLWTLKLFSSISIILQTEDTKAIKQLLVLLIIPPAFNANT